jgi:hypothetical protein
MFTKRRKMIARIMLCLLYISFFTYLLSDIQAITNWNYAVHEMLYMPVTISMILVPILVGVWIYYAFKSRYLNESKNYLATSLVIASIILIGIFFNYESQKVTSSGLAEVEYKTHDEKGYLIQIGDKSLRCDEEMYDTVAVHSRYTVVYTWYKSNPYEGKLISIEKNN